MPYMNGTGPMGTGPNGRGMGPCRAGGRMMGMGRGRRAMAAPYDYDRAAPIDAKKDIETELERLEIRTKALRQRLEEMEGGPQ